MVELKNTSESAPLQVSLCPRDIPNSTGHLYPDCKKDSHAVVIQGFGIDDNGKCQIKFANSWYKDTGKEFLLTPTAFFHAIKNYVDNKDTDYSLTWVKPTNGWQEDSYHAEKEGKYIYKGQAKVSADENGRLTTRKLKGEFQYKNYKFDDGDIFSGRAVADENGYISFKEGHMIYSDGSEKITAKDGSIKFKKYKLTSGGHFTGRGRSVAGGKYSFDAGKILMENGSSKEFDEQGNATFVNYKINDKYIYTGTSTSGPDNTLNLIDGTLIEIETNKKTVFRQGKVKG